MPDVALTWLGHAAFRFDTPGGKRVYVDPFLSGNPRRPEARAGARARRPDRAHARARRPRRRHRRALAALRAGDRRMSSCSGWLASQGAEDETVRARNKGGTVEADGVKFTLTDANHSSSLDRRRRYLGEPCGFVVEVENGTKLYFAGDTNVFIDMQLIGRIYEPDVAILPIGDHFTMGPREAAVALELLGVQALRALPLRHVPAPDRHARASCASSRPTSSS